MRLEAIAPLTENPAPLVRREAPDPVPQTGEILIAVSACGVCHTELDEIEGRTPPPRLPVIPGHQVVGRVAGRGPGARAFRTGERVGVAWVYSACGSCRFCREGRENLCPRFRATGRDADGGYAELMVVPEAFAHRIPEPFEDAAAAPLLCAGAVGWRALKLTGLADGGRLGLIGFGASGHLVLQAARHRYPRAEVLVFARSPEEREFALGLGASWAGAIDDAPPAPLDAAIDTTPAWGPVVAGLGKLGPGGRLVVNAIRKEEGDRAALLGLDYAAHLWLEKELKSVANVSRDDVAEFLALAAEAGIRPAVQEFPLAEANAALLELKRRRIRGAKVLRVAAPGA
jgi:propanol-preferring alcohol dehydrogenase